jgi:hypothetical protein
MADEESPLSDINVTFECQLKGESYRLNIQLPDFLQQLVSLHRPYLLNSDILQRAVGLVLLHILSSKKYGDDHQYRDRIEEQATSLVVQAETLRLAKHMQIICDSFAEGVSVHHLSHPINPEEDGDGA